MKHFDVIVVGGGHAGTEAASAAARLGARTALISLDLPKVGVMSCNPAIGGLGKGHLVREIDALDGVMGRAADRAGIQYRLLNRSRGPAVQGPRIQADRKLYRLAVQDILRATKGLTLIEGEVSDLVVQGGKIGGLRLVSGDVLTCGAVVMTAGTFLNGTIHIGEKRVSGGRVGDKASTLLADQLRELHPVAGRLKTGTPPRLDGRTIDWAVLDSQPGDDDPVMMSFLTKEPLVAQISCGITHTSEATHDIIRKNLHLSAMYGGHIEGVGPRYCPSIEDKVVRFADKTSHQVFLEPEGLDDYTVYPNGISTSLPEDVQIQYVRTLKGLENVNILQPGYAIEYDYFDPRALTETLQSRSLEGLFFAGQLNGTTGYEEAGAQGLVGGMNAAQLALGGSLVPFSRTSSYIGVMIDDLLQRGVSEPYRMFTSRAEHRLSIRADNADQRLTPLGLSLGMVSDERAEAFARKQELIVEAKSILTDKSYSPQDIGVFGLSVKSDGRRRTALDLFVMPDMDRASLFRMDERFEAIAPGILNQVVTDSLYEPYLKRAEQHLEAQRKDEQVRIPDEFEYIGLPGLSVELQTKLTRARPATLSHAAKVEGMTAAALALLHLRVAVQGSRKVGL